MHRSSCDTSAMRDVAEEGVGGGRRVDGAQ